VCLCFFLLAHLCVIDVLFFVLFVGCHMLKLRWKRTEAKKAKGKSRKKSENMYRESNRKVEV